MARPGVTYSQVAEAASKLIGEGTNPTIELVRSVLGTGSSTTISNHLKQWKQTQSETSLLASKEKIPEELLAVLKGLWERVVNQSTESAEKVITEYRERLEEAENELSKYKHNNQRWQNLYNQWNNEKSTLGKKIDSLKEELEDLQCDYSTLDGKYGLVSQQVVEKQTYINELSDLHKQSQKNLDHYKKLYGTQESKIEKIQKALEDEKSSSQQYKEALTEARNKFKDLEKDYQYKHKDLADKVEQLTEALALNEENAAAISKLSMEKDTLNEKYQEIKEAKNIDQSRLIEAKAENKSLISQIQALKTEIKELTQANKKADKEKWSLAQENATLHGQLKELTKYSN